MYILSSILMAWTKSFTPPWNSGGFIISLQFVSVCVCVCLSVCLSVNKIASERMRRIWCSFCQVYRTGSDPINIKLMTDLGQGHSDVIFLYYLCSSGSQLLEARLVFNICNNDLRFKVAGMKLMSSLSLFSNVFHEPSPDDAI